MQLKRFFRRYQALIISIVILLVCGFGFAMGIVPLAQKIVDLNNEFITSSQEVNGLNSKTALLQAVNEYTMRSDLLTLLSAVPSDKSLPTVLSTLDGLAAQTGVSLDTVSLAKGGFLSTASAEPLTADEQAIGTNIIPFTVGFTGTFDQVHAFLTASTSVRRLFRVQTFDVSFGQDNTVAANVSMEAFYSPLPTAIGAVGQPITSLSGTDARVIASVSAMQLLVQPSSLPPPSGGAGKSDPFSL